MLDLEASLLALIMTQISLVGHVYYVFFNGTYRTLVEWIYSSSFLKTFQCFFLILFCSVLVNSPLDRPPLKLGLMQPLQQ